MAFFDNTLQKTDSSEWRFFGSILVPHEHERKDTGETVLYWRPAMGTGGVTLFRLSEEKKAKIKEYAEYLATKIIDKPEVGFSFGFGAYQSAISKAERIRQISEAVEKHEAFSFSYNSSKH
jgi:hypothetical protein